MDNFNTLCSLVSKANLLIEQMDLESVFNSQAEQIANLTNENLALKEQITGLGKQIKELNFKYDKDMELIGNELKSKQEDLASLTKVSYIQSLNKQLVEKTNYCQILESQLDKLKREQNQTSQPNPVIEKLAKKAAEAEAELKAQKEESEKAKMSVGKKSKKQIVDNLVVEQEIVETVEVVENKVEPVHVEPIVETLEKPEVEDPVVEAKPKKSKKSKKQTDEEFEQVVEPITEPVVEVEYLEKTVEESKPKKSKKSKKHVEEEIEQVAEPVAAPVVELEHIEEAVEKEPVVETKPKKKSKKQMVEDDEEDIITKQEPETVEEPVPDQSKSKKSKKSKKTVEETVELEQPVENANDDTINPEKFQDINGFELLEYKSNYYWRDLETSELYDNVSYKPGKIVGLINGKGKVKLH